MCLYTCYVCVNVGMFVVYIVMFHGDYVYIQIYITTYREAWNTCLKSDLTSVTSHHSLKILLLFFLSFCCYFFVSYLFFCNFVWRKPLHSLFRCPSSSYAKVNKCMKECIIILMNNK